jgi:hypothetical protein
MIDERLTEAIAVPKQYEFVLEDGRRLLLTAWNPVVEASNIVRVNASFIIKNKDDKVIPVNKGE